MIPQNAKDNFMRRATNGAIRYGSEVIIEELRALDADIALDNDTPAAIRANIDRRIAIQIKKIERLGDVIS